MTELCHGWSHRTIPLSSTRKYTPEQLRGMCKRVSGPFWLRVENKLIPLCGEECLQLACKVSSAYHDWVSYDAPEEDGFAQDMEEREARISAWMLDCDGNDDSDCEDAWRA
jgi:hypothetical protein